MTDLDTTTIISFRAGPVAPRLAERLHDQPAGRVTRRDLERYYTLLATELASISLTEAEACLVCDACNGLMRLTGAWRYLWAEVADGIRLAGLDRKWGVDGPALVAKLQRLCPAQLLALGDAVERFWAEPQVPASERLRQVGLVRDAAAA